MPWARGASIRGKHITPYSESTHPACCGFHRLVLLSEITSFRTCKTLRGHVAPVTLHCSITVFSQYLKPEPNSRRVICNRQLTSSITISSRQSLFCRPLNLLVCAGRMGLHLLLWMISFLFTGSVFFRLLAPVCLRTTCLSHPRTNLGALCHISVRVSIHCTSFSIVEDSAPTLRRSYDIYHLRQSWGIPYQWKSHYYYKDGLRLP